VARAKMLLAVHEGKSYGAAAQVAGRKSNDAVSHLVSRFNQAGMPLWPLDTAAGRKCNMGRRSASGSSAKHDGSQIQPKTVLPPGR